MRSLLSLCGLSLLAAGTACSVYDEGLLASAGSATQSASSTGGGGGAGGAPGCSSPSDCPGADSECQQRTCAAGVCGVESAADDTPLVEQTAGDCLERRCDGRGGVKDVPLESDVDDGNDCTADLCVEGVPTHTLRAEGEPCAEDGGSYCNATGRCVECVTGAQCASQICNREERCAPPTCANGARNEGETDVDCGGPDCAPCSAGDACAAPEDCSSNTCDAGVCGCGVTHLLISEIRTRGPVPATASAGANEFIELHNPTDTDVVLDAQWTVEARSSTALSYSARWAGSGQTIPAHGYFLIVGSGYGQEPPKNADLSSGISDSGSVRLTNRGVTVDAVCFYFNESQRVALTTGTFECEGTPISNLPHDDGMTPAGNSDVSLERRPGGALGSCADANNNARDFRSASPATPQNSGAP